MNLKLNVYYCKTEMLLFGMLQIASFCDYFFFLSHLFFILLMVLWSCLRIRSPFVKEKSLLQGLFIMKGSIIVKIFFFFDCHGCKMQALR